MSQHGVLPALSPGSSTEPRSSLFIAAPVPSGFEDGDVAASGLGEHLDVVSWVRASHTDTAGVAGLVLEAALDPKTFKSGKVLEL